MKRRRYVLFAFLAICLAIVLSSAGVMAGDLYLHRRYADVAGLNIWGYRGPTVGRKQPNEWRLVVLGESTAFGYGVRWDEAFPAYLQQKINTTARADGRRVSVVNLAYNGEGAHSYKYTLRDYDYLNADAVLFYSGYNDLGGTNTQVFRHLSPIFRATGYLPIFPIIFQEKAMALRAGNLEEAYGGKRTTFKPNITARATASALEQAVSISRSLGDQIGRGTIDTTVDEAAIVGAPCTDRWAHYCGEMYTAVKMALDEGKQVLLVTQPYMSLNAVAVSLHRDQQRRMHAFLREKLGDTPKLRFATLAEAVDVKDPVLCYDGMHLTARGNERVASALVPEVAALMQ
jgi:lysophospholipase L1-like esterase